MKVDVKEYIESGILESYALGSVTPEEKVEVETVAAQYPEIKAELDAIVSAMDKYAALHSAKPSAELRQRVLDSVFHKNRAADTIRRIKAEQEEKSDPRNRMVWSIAASVLVMFCLAANIYTYNRMVGAEAYVHELEGKAKKNDSVMKDMRALYTQAQNDLAILKDPMYKIVELKGQQADTSARAMVCWCPGDKIVYLEVDKMPEAPQGKQYQLWAIVDGKPVSEGMITMGSGLHKMKDVADATAFAVTLENEGGSDIPHGDMIVKGQI